MHDDSGEKQGGLSLERRALNIIEWSFDSTEKVSLLIISKSSLEYIHEVASEVAQSYGEYEDLIRQFLADNYVSRDQYKDSGTFHVQSSGIMHLSFFSSGVIKYQVTWDPFFIDLMTIMCGVFIFVFSIGIVIHILKIRRIIKMKTDTEKTKSKQEFEMYCSRCGEKLDLDSTYCHTCGLPIIHL